MTQIRALIADDEATARRGLRTLLRRHDEVVVVGECCGGKETCEALHRLKPDVVFLDVQMPDMNGFEVLESLDPDELPIVVFVTAFDEYSLQAFDVHAVDYLLKPFTDERFFQALSRAIEQCRQLEAEDFRQKLLALISDRRSRDDHPATAKGPVKTVIREPFLQRLAVGPRDNLRFVDLATVRWIEADSYRIKVHCERGSFSLRGNIGSYERKLNPDEFFRISRSAIVNIAYVRSLRTLFRGQGVVVLSDGTELKVSRGRRPDLVFLLERTRP